MKISSVHEMRALDRNAVSIYGIDELILMENAGTAVCRVIENEFGIKGKTFLVLCGPGNNGGDGFVVARKIHSNGGHVEVVITGARDAYKGPAKKNLDIMMRLPVKIHDITSVRSLSGPVSRSEAIIDAIFGTGIVRRIEGMHRDIIERINKSGRTIFSVDIPSGVNGDTGQIMGIAVRADHTVTFGLPKRGNMLFPGCDLCGKLYVCHISFPPEHYDNDAIKVAINEPPPLPGRYRDAHKGSCGDALFIAGSVNYYGAAYFAARSFLKAGGGYSRLAAPKSVIPFIAQKGSELVCMPCAETAAGTISMNNEKALIGIAEKCDIVVLGPGISTDKETQKLACRLAVRIEKPLIIDGDGITALIPEIKSFAKRKKPTVLTPHPGEMSRITGRSVSEIEEMRIPLLQETARALNSIIVLKGAHTLIGYPDGRVAVNMSGNAGMATAGSGDVLTGTIAAMFGLGLSIEDAVAKGVFIHGLSGDLAAGDIGEDGITAEDILNYLPFAVAADRDDMCDDEALRKRYKITVI